MNTWKVILATWVIFGTGVITGGLLVGYSDRAWHSPAPEPVLADAPPHGNGAVSGAGAARENRLLRPLNTLFRANLMERLNRELKLSQDQHGRIEAIVSEGQDRTRELWRIEWIATRQKIRAELTPEQQARFQELFRPHPRDPRRLQGMDRGSTNAPYSVGSTNSLGAQ